MTIMGFFNYYFEGHIAGGSIFTLSTISYSLYKASAVE